MASLALTVFAAATLLFQLTSCKKGVAQQQCPDCPACPTPTYPVAGLYTGTYSVNSKPELGNRYYSFAVFPDGSLLTKSLTENGDTTYQKGSWTLSSDSTFTGIIATFIEPYVI